MNSGKKQSGHSATLKNIVGLMGILITMSLTACSNGPEASEDVAQNLQMKPEVLEGTAQNVQTEQETTMAEQETKTIADDLAGESTDSEIKGNETINAEESSVNQQENSLQAVENADSKRTAEELLDLFINGSIGAVDSTDLTSAFYISDLNMDSGEWDSFSIGEKVDLDNDGENELIINGPYGGIYLDARDNKIYEFATGEGNALILSYVYYNGAIWIMYSNNINEGYEAYHMERFEGADNLVGEINLTEELVDAGNLESGMKYTLNGEEISYDEYTILGSKIFATEVNTN